MSDVLLYQTTDNGEINITDGLVELTDRFDTAVYLSLFGGNQQDDGSQAAQSLTWWGNLLETEPSEQYVSRTQNIIETLPPISANLRKIEDAATRDLAWMLSTGAATSVTAAASYPALNKVKLTITINGNEKVEFIENWKASK